MLAASIPSEFRQLCMCKGFGTTLTGPALQWYINLPNGSIKSFADLINTFNQQFASSRELEKRSSDLYRITQIKDESLISFLAIFNKEKRLLPNSDLYSELTKYPYHSFEDAQAKTLAYIRLEKDKSYKFGGSCNTKDYDKPNMKSGGSGNNYRSGPYTRPDQSEVNLMQVQQGSIQRLDNMGSLVRWPRKSDNLNPRKDHTKWCEFHMDMGHTTEDCFTLRNEVAYLLKAGYLKDLIKDRGRTKDHSKINQEQKQELGIPDIHHDGLVISMQIGTANVRRILVDGSSSMNLIILDMLKAMKIKEDQITKKSSVLVWFSGEIKNTLGEIYLPTYAEGVASYERFGVLDCLSSYNVIDKAKVVSPNQSKYISVLTK
ncbi:uncharacterized protein LOC141620212 [Silene latifolia]|uniref:uncharacterized protein LOC141620212 n=1 Tax=Silene latifolia TaxID=37657 RepID=UPI003D77DF44